MLNRICKRMVDEKSAPWGELCARWLRESMPAPDKRQARLPGPPPLHETLPRKSRFDPFGTPASRPPRPPRQPRSLCPKSTVGKAHRTDPTGPDVVPLSGVEPAGWADEPDREPVDGGLDAGSRLTDRVGHPPGGAWRHRRQGGIERERIQDLEDEPAPRLAERGDREPPPALAAVPSHFPGAAATVDRLEPGDAELRQLLDEPVGALRLGRSAQEPGRPGRVASLDRFDLDLDHRPHREETHRREPAPPVAGADPVAGARAADVREVVALLPGKAKTRSRIGQLLDPHERGRGLSRQRRPSPVRRFPCPAWE